MTTPIVLALITVIFALVLWYRFERVFEAEATVRLQSEHEHFHLLVDMPDHLTIQPGDTLHILDMPDLTNGRTSDGEMSYTSKIRLIKASSLARLLIRKSSHLEMAELLDEVA
ncbi:MAG: hypothetical protein AAF125_24840 [Chloroflexota bacterium]